MGLISLICLTSFLPLQRRFLTLCSADQSFRDLERLACQEIRHCHFHPVPLTLRSGLRDPENDGRVTFPRVRNVDTRVIYIILMLSE